MPKTVHTVSGDFEIAPLTLRQVEDLQKPETGITTLVYIALKNAGFTGSEDSLRDILSYKSLRELRDAVYDISGLEVSVPGEAPAAETASTNSTAA